MKVTTTDGKLHTATRGEKQNSRPLTEAEADAICKQANAEAERLGIKTRYTVVPD